MQPFAFFKKYYIQPCFTSRAAVGFQINKYTHGCQTIKDLLQSQKERSCRCEKLASTAKVAEDVAKRWLTKQALWQIYLPPPRYIPRPKFDVSLSNAVHQADLLFLPHDKLSHRRKVYKYALTVVDVASRYKAAEPLTSKE